MKRRYEEITKAEFDKLVRSIFPDASIMWDDVPQHLEPPDWYLTLNNIRYAVEATSVVDLLSITPDSKLSAANVSATLFAFIKIVEVSAKTQGILSGAYVVTLCPIPNFSQNRSILSSKLLTYIRETKSLPSAPEFTLGYVRHQRISIKKVHSNKNSVSAGLSMGVKRHDKVQEDLLQSVTKSLAEKVYKLRHVSDPIILLLLDEYHYSFVADWNPLISSCPDRFRFCCICRILPPDENVILWAKSPEWKPVVTG